MSQTNQASPFLSRLNRFLVLGVIAAAVAHFLVLNDLSTNKGFVFKELKAQANELASENQSIESAVSSLASYQSLNPRIQSLKLVAADNVSYVSSEQQVVAAR